MQSRRQQAMALLARRPSARREPAQIIVLFALFIVVLMVLAGSAYDYASIVADDAQLQNAVDAAALAGANALSANASKPAGTPVAVAQTVTTTYLQQNGVATATPGTNISLTFPTSTPVAGTPSAIVENLSVSVTRNHATAFWPLVGINSVSMRDAGGAHAARGMVDVLLSLDTTYSEVYTGSFTSIQNAVVTFINTMNPSTTDPRGPAIGIARFGGIKCTYDNQGNGNYVMPCADDENVLIPLTQDKTQLLTVAQGPNNSSCPVGAAAAGGCPLAHVYYQAPNATGCPDSCSAGYSTTSGSFGNYSPAATGTKLPNAFSVLGLSPISPYTNFLSGYAWATSNGGRNNVTAGANARKVMVMMTDGQDEMWPLPGPGGTENVASYDATVKAMADQLKLGPDHTAGTPDDVEVYVIGYFCTPYAPGATQVPQTWCQSAIADTTAPHPCPGSTWPPAGVTPSSIDNLLWSLSSSTPGTCDHYFPLGKSENLLPQLFTDLAGRISRGQLTS
ncbi:MAG: hypothetical protein NVSMB2_22740 [Chloroflexota bacterium]